MLFPRLLTGVVGAILILGSIYFGKLPFLFVVLGLVMLAVRKFYVLAEQTGYPSYPTLGLVASVLVVFSFFLSGVSLGQVTDNQTTSAILALLMILIVTRSLTKGPADTSLSEWGMTLLGVFYV